MFLARCAHGTHTHTDTQAQQQRQAVDGAHRGGGKRERERDTHGTLHSAIGGRGVSRGRPGRRIKRETEEGREGKRGTSGRARASKDERCGEKRRIEVEEATAADDIRSRRQVSCPDERERERESPRVRIVLFHERTYATATELLLLTDGGH